MHIVPEIFIRGLGLALSTCGFGKYGQIAVACEPVPSCVFVEMSRVYGQKKNSWLMGEMEFADTIVYLA